MRKPFHSVVVLVFALALADCMHARRTGPAPTPNLFHYFGPGAASLVFLLAALALVLRLSTSRLQRVCAVSSIWGAATGVFAVAYLLVSDAGNSESGIPSWIVSLWNWLAISALLMGFAGALCVRTRLPRDVWLKAPGLLAFPAGPLLVAGVAYIAQLRDVSFELLLSWFLNAAGVLLWLAVRHSRLLKSECADLKLMGDKATSNRRTPK